MIFSKHVLISTPQLELQQRLPFSILLSHHTPKKDNDKFTRTLRLHFTRLLWTLPAEGEKIFWFIPTTINTYESINNPDYQTFTTKI